MSRLQQLREKLVMEFTPYTSWDEFQHERQRHQRGDFKEQGR